MHFLDSGNELDDDKYQHPTDTATFAWSIARNITMSMPERISLAKRRMG